METSKLIEEIQKSIEWLETVSGDEVECISIEELQSILSKFLGKEIKLSLE